MLLYYRLLSLVDDYGRYDWDADIIRGRCFYFTLDRWTTERVSECLLELSRPTQQALHPLVTEYEVNGKKYLQIEKFGQRAQSRPKFPPPPPVVVNGNRNSSKSAPPPATGNESPRFEEWWSLWSEIRGTARLNAAERAWVSVVTTGNFQECMECTRSYLASLDQPNKGFNPDNFLFEQAKDYFKPRWPEKGKSKQDRLTPTQQAIAEAKQRRSDG